MEIERKYLVRTLPENLGQYSCHEIEQAYLITDPVLRIRKLDKQYILTYKSAGLMTRQEEEFPLDEEAYQKLLAKTEGNVITKMRYEIPIADGLIAELDIFKGCFEGLILVEVEFPDITSAHTFTPPDWFGEDVTYDKKYQNSNLSLIGY